jgi:hypothetical protein
METIKKSTEGQVAGIIGIVLAIIALIVAFIPCVGAVAFIPGGLALIFSIISIIQASRGSGSKSLGIISMIVSFIAIIIAAIWLVVFGGLSVIANKALNDPDKIERIEKGIKDAFNQDREVVNQPRLDSLESRLRDLEALEAEKDKNEDKDKE